MNPKLPFLRYTFNKHIFDRTFVENLGGGVTMITRRQFMERGTMALLALQVSEMAEVPGDNFRVQDASELTVRDAISIRRTIRSFSDRPLTKEQALDLLWAAQGITDNTRGFRSTPSAGALYPIEVVLVAGPETVAGLEEGVYRYRPQQAEMVQTVKNDIRLDLAQASLDQMWMARAPVNLVLSAVYAKTMRKYGERGIRYAHIEAGCTGQNVFLMAAALGLAAGIVGAFEDTAVASLLSLPEGTTPLLVMPVGYAG
jgi:SagB-type dehydrogenase family enzyme